MKRVLLIILAILLVSCKGGDPTGLEKESKRVEKELLFSGHDHIEPYNFEVVEPSDKLNVVGDVLEFDTHQAQVVGVYKTDEGKALSDRTADYYLVEIMYKNTSDDFLLVSPCIISLTDPSKRRFLEGGSQYLPDDLKESVYLEPGCVVTRVYSYVIDEGIPMSLDILHMGFDSTQTYTIDLSKGLRDIKPLAREDIDYDIKSINSNEIYESNNLELVVRDQRVDQVISVDDPEKIMDKIKVDIHYKNMRQASYYYQNVDFDMMLLDENGVAYKANLSYGDYLTTANVMSGGIHDSSFYFDVPAVTENMSLLVVETWAGKKTWAKVNLNGEFSQAILKQDYKWDEKIKVYQVNEVARLGELEIVMLDQYDRLSSDDSQPKDGFVYRVAKLEVKNTAGGNAGLEPAYFRIMTQTGFYYSIHNYFGASEQPFSSRDLQNNPGPEIQRHAFAEVPLNQVLYLVYRDPDGNQVVFDFSCPQETLE